VVCPLYSYPCHLRSTEGFSCAGDAINRYQDRPVYFSDIIVNADSGLKTFDDLAGKTLCYNDQALTAATTLRQRLMQFGHPSSFFGKVIQSGSSTFHQTGC